MDIVWLVPAAGIVAILFAALLARDVLCWDDGPATERCRPEGQTRGSFAGLCGKAKP